MPSRPGASLGVGALVVPALFAALLLLAPPNEPLFWGVNGLRSLDPLAAVLVIAVSLATAFLPRIENQSAVLRWSVAIAAAWVIAFPLREKIHFLGDTQLRVQALSVAGAGIVPLVASWWERMHANPLDLAVNILGVSALRSVGLSLIQAVSLVSFVLALLFFAGCWRLAGGLAADRSPRWSLAAALSLSGVLVAFAGYPESAGLVAVTVTWWWAEALAPLTTRAQAWRTTAAFLALALAHRVGIVMALPLMWRSLGPAFDGDDPAVRRTSLRLAIAAIALIAIVTVTTGSGGDLASNARDLLDAAKRGLVKASDALNALALVAPLAFMAWPVAGGRALREWLRTPAAIAIVLASVPLVVAIEILYPGASYHLGPEREWEASLLPGISLTVAGASILSRLPTPSRRAALTVLLPVLGLVAGSWLAVNASREVATRRAMTWAERPSSLSGLQRGYLHLYLGQRAMNEGRPRDAGRHFEEAFDSGGNARRALMACEAWFAAGDPVAARRALDKARSRAPLGPELERSVRTLEEMLAPAGTDTLPMQ